MHEADNVLPNTSSPGPHHVTYSAPPNIPSIPPSPMISTMSIDTHITSPKSYPPMVPSYTTITCMLFTEYIPRTEPTEVPSPQPRSSPPPNPRTFPSMLPTVYTSLVISHFFH